MMCKPASMRGKEGRKGKERERRGGVELEWGAKEGLRGVGEGKGGLAGTQLGCQYRQATYVCTQTSTSYQTPEHILALHADAKLT